MTDEWVEACKVDDLDDEESMVVEALDNVALHRIDGEFLATSDSCTHERWSLGEEGEIEDGEIHCTLHNARFNLRSGAALCFPAMIALDTYPTKVEGDTVFVGTTPNPRVED